MSDFTTYELERMAAGEIETPPAAEERVAALRSANEAILTQYPGSDIVPRIQAARFPVARRAPAVLAIAVVLIAVLAYALRPAPANVEDPGIRLKGSDLKLHIFKSQIDGEVLLNAGDQVDRGDLLQAKIALGEPSFIGLFSTDGRGAITAIQPTTMLGESPRYERGTQATPMAMKLDDAPDFERFTLIACPESFILGEMVDRVRSGSSVEPCSIDTVQLSKP